MLSELRVSVPLLKLQLAFQGSRNTAEQVMQPPEVVNLPLGAGKPGENYFVGIAACVLLVPLCAAALIGRNVRVIQQLPVWICVT